ncbi:MAG: DUF2252 family protein [Candidatus Dormiibacterota bacterium]
MPTTDIAGATRAFERWLGQQVDLVRVDLDYKHELMAADPFVFLRGTFYRWAQVWPEVMPEDAAAPRLNAVGDLHVENFGTWRDVEGRLVWGINDLDEADLMPYTIDLVRLATSARMATAEGHLSLPGREAASAILAGYAECLDAGGLPFVLAERDRWLRRIAWNDLRDPTRFWARITALPAATNVPPVVEKALKRDLPKGAGPPRLTRRRSGVGSLGRPRIVARAELNSALVAREAKSMALSAWEWARPDEAAGASLYQATLERAVRCPDPFWKTEAGWILRRISPDCSRIELGELAKKRDEFRLLRAMGWETANIHLGSHGAIAAVKRDLKGRTTGWLHRAARIMSDAVRADWKEWRRANATRSVSR